MVGWVSRFVEGVSHFLEGVSRFLEGVSQEKVTCVHVGMVV